MKIVLAFAMVLAFLSFDASAKDIGKFTVRIVTKAHDGVGTRYFLPYRETKELGETIPGGLDLTVDKKK